MTVFSHKYNESFYNDWNNLVDNSLNGTFMHRRDFIDYHKDKFKDASLVFTIDNKVCGVFPAALHKGDIVSHPGTAMGGLVYNSKLRLKIPDLIWSIRSTEFPYEKIIYKATPKEFQKHPVEDDIWGLLTTRAKIVKTELSSVVSPLLTNYSYSKERLDDLKTIQNNIKLSAMPLHDLNFIQKFWNEVTIPNLKKYDVDPTHTPEDMHYLYSKFPVYIKGLLATHIKSGKFLGGLIIFRFNKCYHVQYSVSTSKGRALKAMTLLHHFMIENLPSDVHYYSFGKLTEHNGLAINEGLYEYKNSFGGGSFVYNTYEY